MGAPLVLRAPAPCAAAAAGGAASRQRACMLATVSPAAASSAGPLSARLGNALLTPAACGRRAARSSRHRPVAGACARHRTAPRHSLLTPPGRIAPCALAARELSRPRVGRARAMRRHGCAAACRRRQAHDLLVFAL
jgi:hypothetical protein